MTYAELKKVLYIAETGFGVFLLYLASRSAGSVEPVYALTSWAEALIGAGLIIFGVLTFIFRDDPDIWR